MNEAFQKLKELGVGEFAHIDGSLIDHLQGTRKLLKKWSASNILQDAGLYHAAYGTANYADSFISLQKRDEISNIIGSEAESIVYLYCACDREYFWPQIGTTPKLKYKNRFTNELRSLNSQQLSNFCELTVANEIEIAMDNPTFINKHGKSLYLTFSNMHPYISESASKAVQLVLGSRNE